jgi:hypothetical protein
MLLLLSLVLYSESFNVCCALHAGRHDAKGAAKALFELRALFVGCAAGLPG